MFNFLDSKLNPVANASCPHMEGYEVTNLISEHEHLKYKGFLAFPAIKPPIEIDFKLICPIKIHYISIWNTVNSQKSSGFEIHVAENSENYTLVGKTFPEGSGFVMCDRRLYGNNKPTMPNDFSLCFFKPNEYKMLGSADKIKIKIIRTISAVPCLAKIEIWGKPSNTCSVKTKETIAYLMTPKIRIAPNLEQPSTSQKLNDFEIPSEFLDAISYEVMSIPMTLPCGKNVDQTTIEKCIDANIGKLPYDPFTGVQFSKNSKPVLNAALKNRIDLFLLQNKDRVETQNIQRTVGRKINTEKIPEYAELNNKKIKLDENCLKSPSSDDLDAAIEETMNKYNVTRFSKLETNSDENKFICCYCKTDCNMYEIKSCKHLICRMCLTKRENICNICHNSFKKTDVQKYHTV